VAQPGGIRSGVFAAYALAEFGHIETAALNSFARRAREMDCAAYLFVNGTLHQENLMRLAERMAQTAAAASRARQVEPGFHRPL
jgi:hypothetical protein